MKSGMISSAFFFHPYISFSKEPRDTCTVSYDRFFVSLYIVINPISDTKQPSIAEVTRSRIDYNLHSPVKEGMKKRPDIAINWLSGIFISLHRYGAFW